ncbi:hypothetical protein Efla_002199 [Eimeria flavescens]
MRGELLAVLSGRLPVGLWECHFSVCLPSPLSSGVWRLAGRQTDGLPASTVFRALTHADVEGNQQVTFCKVTLLKGKASRQLLMHACFRCLGSLQLLHTSGSLHSVRLHAAALGHPVVGECTYTSTIRSFAPPNEVSIHPSLRERLLQLHKRLHQHHQQQEQQQQQEWAAAELDEPLMLVPWRIRGSWRELHAWPRKGAAASSAAAATPAAAAAGAAAEEGGWQHFEDVLSSAALSDLFPLDLVAAGASPPAAAKQKGDRQKTEQETEAETESCCCWQAACGDDSRASLWRHYR